MPRLSFSLLLLSLVATTVAAQPSATRPDHVRLVGGEERHGTVEVRRRGGEAPYLLLDGKERYPLSRVVVFSSDSSYFVRYGYATPQSGGQEVDSFFLERLNTGALTLYARVDWNRPDVEAPTPDYFSVSGGPLQEVTASRLRDALRASPASQRLLDASDRWRWLEYGLLLAGAATTAYGAYDYLTHSESTFDFNAYLPLGFAIGITSGYPRQKKSHAWRAAVAAYGTD